MTKSDADCLQSYIPVLMDPFKCSTGKMPRSSRYGPTYSFKKTYFTNFSPNLNGDAFLQWIPNSIGPTTGTRTPLLIDNTATYSPTTGQTTGVTPQNLLSILGWNTADVKTINVVSAGLRIYIENPSTTLQPKGRMYSVREVEPRDGFVTTGILTEPQNEHTLSYIISAKNHHDFKNNNYLAWEYVYSPRSFSDFNMKNGNSNLLAAPTHTDEHTIVFTRFETTAVIFVELYYIFECTVEPEGAYRGFGTINKSISDPVECVASINLNDDLFIRQVKLDSTHAHQIKQASAIYTEPKTNIINKVNHINAHLKDGTEHVAGDENPLA